MTMAKVLGACALALAAVAASTAVGTPPTVLFFDMDAAVQAEALSYEEQLIAFVFQV